MIRDIFLSLFYRKDGSAIIEFAIVAPIFFLIFFGVTEFGLFMYHKITVERIAVEVSRITSIGKNNDSECSGLVDPDNPDSPKSREAYITCIVKNSASVLINGDKTGVSFATIVPGSPSTTPPDICFDNEPPSSPAQCNGVFEDLNGNGQYDGSVATSAGNAGEVIEVRISYPWSVQFPVLKNYFGSAAHKGVVMLTASTVIKNEPF